MKHQSDVAVYSLLRLEEVLRMRFTSARYDLKCVCEKMSSLAANSSLTTILWICPALSPNPALSQSERDLNRSLVFVRAI